MPSSAALSDGAASVFLNFVQSSARSLLGPAELLRVRLTLLASRAAPRSPLAGLGLAESLLIYIYLRKTPAFITFRVMLREGCG